MRRTYAKFSFMWLNGIKIEKYYTNLLILIFQIIKSKKLNKPQLSHKTAMIQPRKYSNKCNPKRCKGHDVIVNVNNQKKKNM